MAIAYLSFEQFKKNLKKGFIYIISYDKKKYSIGQRFITMSPYYFLNHQNLDMKTFYTLNDLFTNVKIDGKILADLWEEIVILKIKDRLDFDDEVKIIQEYSKEYGV